MHTPLEGCLYWHGSNIILSCHRISWLRCCQAGSGRREEALWAEAPAPPDRKRRVRLCAALVPRLGRAAGWRICQRRGLTVQILDDSFYMEINDGLLASFTLDELKIILIGEEQILCQYCR